MTIFEEMIKITTVKTETAWRRSAARMRRCRARRRAGFRCLTIELHDTEIDALVHRGLLTLHERDDLEAVVAAVHNFIEHTIGRSS